MNAINLPGNPRKVIRLFYSGESESSEILNNLPRVVPPAYGREDLSESEAHSEPPFKRGIYIHTYSLRDSQTPESLENWFTDRHRICGRT